MTAILANMLKPNKHLDLDRSLLRVSAIILGELRRRRMMRFETVRALTRRRVGDDADVILLPALELLYLVGRLEYHLKTDSFEYIEAETEAQ